MQTTAMKTTVACHHHRAAPNTSLSVSESSGIAHTPNVPFYPAYGQEFVWFHRRQGALGRGSALSQRLRNHHPCVNAAGAITPGAGLGES